MEKNSPQVVVDLAGNVLMAQTHTTLQGRAGTDISGQVFHPVDGHVIVRIQLTNYNDCDYIAVYQGKMYLICNSVEGDRQIIVIDYLK